MARGKGLAPKKRYYSPYPTSSSDYFKDVKLRRLYDITLGDWNDMFSNQKGCCGICEVHQSQTSKVFNVDHCHKFKKVRELLCCNCNLGLGQLQDKVYNIKRAIEYLKEDGDNIQDLIIGYPKGKPLFKESIYGKQIKYRLHKLWQEYKMSLEDYNRIIEFQKDKCPICETKLSEYKGQVCVDHKHDYSKKIRGILCDPCNGSLGRFKDNINMLEKVITYLNKYQG